MTTGRIRVNDVLRKARSGDSNAVAALFRGFLSDGETIRAGGYLGVLGYLLPEHSFWCVTDYRVCGLLVRRGGRLQFTSGFLGRINSIALKQPSLVVLWLIMIAWVLTFTLIGVGMNAGIGAELGESLPGWLAATLGAGVGLGLLRWAIRIYYRFSKSGVVFWMRERIPVYLFADRQSLTAAQRLIATFTAVKKKEQPARASTSPARYPVAPVVAAAAG